MVPHQVRQYEDNYKGEMSSTMVAHHAPVLGQPPQPPLHQQGQVQHQKDPYIGEEGIQQVPVIQQGDQYEGAMVKEVVTQPVLHEEVVIPANTAQPFQQEKEFVIKQVDIAQPCTTSPRESDNNRQAQSKQRCCTTSPRESDNDRQAQTKQRGATTDPQPEANGTKKATEGESAMYNQHTACSTNQVSFSTLTDVMLPSQSWTDAITMPHNGKWGHVRDPGPKEGGARHDDARHYPYQHVEGRRHHLSPLRQNTPPQGPYMVGPPEPNTEASQKQTYVPGQDFYKLKTFTSKVKVVPLTYYEELLIRCRAMCLILCYSYRHILFFVVFSKTAPFLGLKSIVFGPNYYVTTANCSAIYPLFL